MLLSMLKVIQLRIVDRDDIQISDQDSDIITGATITLTNAQTRDLFLYDGLPSGITTSVSISGSTIVVTLSGSATTTNYQDALKVIRFSNSTDAPNLVDREITIAVTDGANNSNTASSTIRVVTADDAPVVDPGANNSDGDKFTTTYTEKRRCCLRSSIPTSPLKMLIQQHCIARQSKSRIFRLEINCQ